MKTRMDVNSSFTASELLYGIYCQKTVKQKKTKVSFRLVDSSEDFLSGCTNNKKDLGFVSTTGLPGKVVESISGHGRL